MVRPTFICFHASNAPWKVHQNTALCTTFIHHTKHCKKHRSVLTQTPIGISQHYKFPPGPQSTRDHQDPEDIVRKDIVHHNRFHHGQLWPVISVRNSGINGKRLLLSFKSYKALCSLIFSCLTMVSCDLFFVSGGISVKRLLLPYKSLQLPRHCPPPYLYSHLQVTAGDCKDKVVDSVWALARAISVHIPLQLLASQGKYSTGSGCDSCYLCGHL